MTSSNVEFTEEVFNFIRLSSLLDFTKLPLIYLLETEEPLGCLLKRKRKILDRLVKINKIYQDEKKILGEIKGSADPDKLDVRLLCVLVRNIGTVPPPENGWAKKKLKAEDKSIGADVIRIGDIRNDCHHLPSSNKITREKFDDIYPRLKEILKRLVHETPHENAFLSLVCRLDTPDFATSECAKRLSLDKVIHKWKKNTTRQESLEDRPEPDIDDSNEENDSCPFLDAILANNIETVRTLAKSQTQTGIEEGVWRACLKGNHKIFEILTSNGQLISLNHRDLAKACRGGSKEIVKQILERMSSNSLLDHVKDESVFKRCCIHYAANGGFQDIVECLIKTNEKFLLTTDKFNNNALHFACMRGHIEVVRVILKSEKGKKQIGDLNGKGLTPLHCAAYFGKLFTVQLLLEGGADKNSKDRQGRSVVKWCTMGQEQSIQCSWYDSEFNLLPATYGSHLDYEQIKIILGDFNL
ncbi:ankyrin repeat domain-containing protein 17-like [Saccostrea echinata]|uniref:ankyrin repeat domain-containing protein 17-like n=1 Tax=Saccostrea echinata TaxID=191078 RepID=UPI002A800637|nr:ankyrin repeat domain-containing protein 17-like [Saccostrea echinata]